MTTAHYPNGRVVCQTCPASVPVATDRRAIVRLITAAPDLLAACEDAIQFISNGVELGYIHLPEKGDRALLTLPALLAAVAKAKGERQ